MVAYAATMGQRGSVIGGPMPHKIPGQEEDLYRSKGGFLRDNRTGKPIVVRMPSIPNYVLERILRKEPARAGVVPNSTPVVSFGDARTARVATLALNPSRREFFPTPRLAVKGSSPEEVFMGCNNYFHNCPYRWFDHFRPSLNAFRASYGDGSACHLDLVQWATDPVWRGLARPVRERLINEDAPFLKKQLRTNENIGLLLVNGSGVWRQLCRRLGVEDIHSFPDALSGFSYHPMRFFSGSLFGRLRILAWSTNLQSSPGVTDVLCEKKLPARLAELYAERWG